MGRNLAGNIVLVGDSTFAGGILVDSSILADSRSLVGGSIVGGSIVGGKLAGTADDCWAG